MNIYWELNYASASVSGTFTYIHLTSMIKYYYNIYLTDENQKHRK